MKILICVLAIYSLFGLTGLEAQPTDESNQSASSSKQSNFKKLFDKKDVIVITEKYELDKYKENELKIFAMVGWIDGEMNKIYAANVGEVFVDYEQINKLQDDIDKLIQKIENSYTEDKIISIRYISPDGIFINYYNFKHEDGRLYKNVYFKYGDFVLQDKTTDTIKRFSNSIARVREKLIALGAKR